MFAHTFWLTACHSWGTAHAAAGIYIAYACCEPTRPARPHTLPHPPHCPLQLPSPLPPSHLPERIVKFIFIFMAWLCFNAARSACLCALFAAFNIFSELAAVQFPSLPSSCFSYASAAAFFACHLTVCWHFYKIHVRVRLLFRLFAVPPHFLLFLPASLYLQLAS